MWRTPATASRYPFYRMAGVNLESERAWQKFLFLLSVWSEHTTTWSTVRRVITELSSLSKMTRMRQITPALLERILAMKPPKTSLSAATHYLKIPHRTSCCDTFFHGPWFHLATIISVTFAASLDLKTVNVIAAFLLHSNVGYCNSLYLNLLPKQISRLQFLQNSLAREVTVILNM